jgi:hypothetical protein
LAEALDPELVLVGSDKARDGYKMIYPMTIKENFSRYEKFFFQVSAEEFSYKEDFESTGIEGENECVLIVSHANTIRWLIALFDYQVDRKDTYCVDYCCLSAVSREARDIKE